MLDSRAAPIPVIGECLRLKYADTNTSICLLHSIVHERVRVYCHRIDDHVFPSGTLASILPITLSSPTTKYRPRRDNSSYSEGPKTHPRRTERGNQVIDFLWASFIKIRRERLIIAKYNQF